MMVRKEEGMLKKQCWDVEPKVLKAKEYNIFLLEQTTESEQHKNEKKPYNFSILSDR